MGNGLPGEQVEQTESERTGGERIRVLYVMRPAAGGMKQHLLNLVRGLAGSMSDCYTPAPGCVTPGCIYDIAVAGPCDDASLTAELRDAGAGVFHVPITGRIDPIRDARAISLLRKHVAAFRPHIVHCHGFKAGITGRAAISLSPRQKRPLMVYTIHNSVIERTRGTPAGAFCAFLESMFAGQTDCVITISEALRRDYLSIRGTCPERVVCIPNGIDLSRFNHDPAPADGRPGEGSNLGGVGDTVDSQIRGVWIGTVARLIPAKGVGVFIKAARQLVDRGLNATFLIVGDGPQRPELETLAGDLDIQSRVRFLGFRDDIPAILGSLDLFVLPTLSEGMSITILEAMAAGVPVVASDVGGVSEVVTDGATGWLTTPGDAAALAGAMETALSNPDKARAMASRARLEVKENFDLRTMLQRTDRLYRDLLTSKGRACFRS
ncbi:MAG: glycosyltransferase family 4 protein [Firmicutes bacterium]|nr:glycosyltransferase family 4 protein [Bacillota bacterium]